MSLFVLTTSYTYILYDFTIVLMGVAWKPPPCINIASFFIDLVSCLCKYVDFNI